MLQRLFHAARVNVFESARFYYWVLVVLTFHLFLRHSINKVLYVNGESEWLISKIVTAVFYGVVYSCCVVSAILLRKRISKHFLYTWLIICCIAICNEFLFLTYNYDNYDLRYSITSGQMFTNIKFTFPILFLGIWISLQKSTWNSFNFLKLVYHITLFNSLLTCIGMLFGISLFESYPNSGRWGYSGLFSSVYSVIFSCIFLIDKIDNFKFDVYKALLCCSLLFSGTKSGILSLILILLIVVIKSFRFRTFLFSAIIFTIAFPSFWIPTLVNYSPFWKNVYSNHGYWSILSSLRDKNLSEFIIIIDEKSSVYNWVLGGSSRFEDFWVEIFPVDVFLFFGVSGFFVLTLFYLNFIRTWRLSVPFIVASLNGTLLITSFIFLVYGVWIWVDNQKDNL